MKLRSLASCKHKCRGCMTVMPYDEMDPIDDLLERMHVGENAPSGQCPECGELCDPIVDLSDYYFAENPK